MEPHGHSHSRFTKLLNFFFGADVKVGKKGGNTIRLLPISWPQLAAPMQHAQVFRSSAQPILHGYAAICSQAIGRILSAGFLVAD